MNGFWSGAIGALAGLALMVGLFGVFIMKPLALPLVEHVYQVQWGKVQCAQHDLTPCGVTLSKCQDTNVYMCLTNVFYEDSKP